MIDRILSVAALYVTARKVWKIGAPPIAGARDQNNSVVFHNRQLANASSPPLARFMCRMRPRQAHDLNATSDTVMTPPGPGSLLPRRQRAVLACAGAPQDYP